MIRADKWELRGFVSGVRWRQLAQKSTECRDGQLGEDYRQHRRELARRIVACLSSQRGTTRNVEQKQLVDEAS